MAAITTIVAIAGVAAAIGGTIASKQQAAKTAKAAKKRSDKAQAAALAKKPGTSTQAEVALGGRDKDRRQGKGSLAQRRKTTELAGPSASSVGGLL